MRTGYFWAFLGAVLSLSAQEAFFLLEVDSGEILESIGDVDKRVSPCSTFKIPLSLMGYDAGILQDELTPMWEFRTDYDDFLDAWKGPQSPQSWMRYSCVWYSKLISCQLGLTAMQDYLAAFDYGNRVMVAEPVWPGEKDPAWLHSAPLAISPREQVAFICNLLQYKFPIASVAIDRTKAILFKEELPQGGKLFGKTGWSGSIGRDDPTVLEYAWFVGWIEIDQWCWAFAYLIHEQKIKLDQRIPRVLELLSHQLKKQTL